MIKPFGAWATLVFQGQVFSPSEPAPSTPGSTRCHQYPVSEHALYFRCHTSRREFLHLFALKKKTTKNPMLWFHINQFVTGQTPALRALTCFLFFTHTPFALKPKLFLEIQPPRPQAAEAEATCGRRADGPSAAQGHWDVSLLPGPRCAPRQGHSSPQRGQAHGL